MPFSVEFRVRYAETDQMGVVHHSVYFVWFEHFRTEYFIKIGFPYSELEKKGIYFPVVESGCKYISSATYDGMINVKGYFESPKGVRVRLNYNVEQSGKKIAEGYTLHASLDRNGSPSRIPEKLLAVLDSEANSNDFRK